MCIFESIDMWELMVVVVLGLINIKIHVSHCYNLVDILCDFIAFMLVGIDLGDLIAKG